VLGKLSEVVLSVATGTSGTPVPVKFMLAE